MSKTKLHVATTINGDAVEFLCEPQQTLLDVLRDELRLTGSKEGCASGDCGACSVILDGRLVCACLVLAAETGGCRVEHQAGAALVGTRLDDADLDAMAAAASAACNPIDDKRGTVEYRTKVAGVIARRACAIALDRARSN